jgi:2-polyprenyl-6-methoxyphenol hydroxylase-like FAD-dependent oxidoreductase
MPKVFDVIVVGGGIAGSVLGGVLARAGLGVLVFEKEPRFRDRVRGEGTWPYGVADALAMDLGVLLARAGAVDLVGVKRYADQRLVSSYEWATDTIGGISEIGFSHPRLQEEAFAWAAEQGAASLRPAKVVRFARNGVPTVTVLYDGDETEYAARLVVGADGKTSATRRWPGGESVTDPEHHRFGGVLVSGVQTDDRDTDNLAGTLQVSVNWFAAGANATRLYLLATAQRLREWGADRSFAALIKVAAAHMPEGALDGALQEGPIGFFPNSNTWASKVSGNGVALIGDAAGAPDPSLGHGTAMLFHDVRTLTELLLDGHDWDSATGAYAMRRDAYYAAVRAYDRWHCTLDSEEGAEADRLREGHKRAKQADPTLGGWALIEARGPDGLIPDAAARRFYFGEDLA